MDLSDWHRILNKKESLPPQAFRRNSGTFELVSYVNCTIGCVLSERGDMIPVWIERCRQFMAQRVPEEDEKKYYALVAEYLHEVERGA